jgi:hypothetical protein
MPVAKGLCGKHYQRQRRTGDPEKVRPAGRPWSNPKIQATRQSGLAAEWSPRTLARYVRAWDILDELGEDFGAAVAAATRANGTINVSRFERIADAALMKAVLDRE